MKRNVLKVSLFVGILSFLASIHPVGILAALGIGAVLFGLSYPGLSALARRPALVERLEGIDRRVIFLIMGIAIVIPLIHPIGVVPNTTDAVDDFYRAIEELPEGATVLLAGDWDPGSVAELKTGTVAVLTHLCQRRIKIIALCLWPQGPRIVGQTIEEVCGSFDYRYGIDYVYLGFVEGRELAILSMGESFKKTYPKDFRGTPTDEIPLLEDKDAFDDVAMIVSLSAGYPGTKEWVQQVATRWETPLISCTGGVSAPEYYPYWNTGQLKGLIGGIPAMAAYENMIGAEGFAVGVTGAQSVGHYTLITLILIGNILYFIRRQR